MRFIKSFFSSNPKEEIRQKLVGLELGSEAIELPVVIEEENFRLVVEVANQLVNEGRLEGRLIGKKGWFLPNADTKLENAWKKLERGPVNLERLADDWEINEKRVYIALSDYAMEKDETEPVFHREGMDIWLFSYLRKSWIDVLSSFDFDEDQLDFDSAMDKTHVNDQTKEVLVDVVKEWLQDSSSSFALGNDQIIRRRDMIPELVTNIVPQWFEEGRTEVTYDDIATKYGITEEEAGEILQDLIDKRALGEVTLYPLDHKLMPRL